MSQAANSRSIADPLEIIFFPEKTINWFSPYVPPAVKALPRWGGLPAGLDSRWNIWIPKSTQNVEEPLFLVKQGCFGSLDKPVFQGQHIRQFVRNCCTELESGMRINDLKLEVKAKTAKASARIEWEDSEKPSSEVFFETPAEFAQDLDANPHSFLAGCLPPAIFHAEKRIILDHPVCPNFLEGLNTIMAHFAHWYGKDGQGPILEVKTLSKPRLASPRNRAGIFLSGGVDSLAALYSNHQRFSPEHPAYIKDGILIHGFDIGGRLKWGAKQHVFDRAKAAMAEVAEDADIRLIPLLTNIRHLADSRMFWIKVFFGAVLAACGHALDKRFDLLYIASSYDIPNLNPCASHPMIDPEYSSYSLLFKHRDLLMNRLQKVKLLSKWETGLNNMRVCFANAKDRYNCGRCEKCVRTMAELEAVGALEKCRAFPLNVITPDMIKAEDVLEKNRYIYWREMLPGLEARGRKDLVEAIENILAAAGE
jgi:hypothetical protein